MADCESESGRSLLRDLDALPVWLSVPASSKKGWAGLGWAGLGWAGLGWAGPAREYTVTDVARAGGGASRRDRIGLANVVCVVIFLQDRVDLHSATSLHARAHVSLEE